MQSSARSAMRTAVPLTATHLRLFHRRLDGSLHVRCLRCQSGQTFGVQRYRRLRLCDSIDDQGDRWPCCQILFLILPHAIALGERCTATVPGSISRTRWIELAHATRTRHTAPHPHGSHHSHGHIQNAKVLAQPQAIPLAENCVCGVTLKEL